MLIAKRIIKNDRGMYYFWKLVENIKENNHV